MRPPSQTLYCNNLNDQITKTDLRRALFHLFSQYGTVIDVVALKTPRMRGQAWIVFDEVMAATNALRQLQGFPFYGKAVRIDYAKTMSDAVARMQKVYIPREKRQALSDVVTDGGSKDSQKQITDGSSADADALTGDSSSAQKDMVHNGAAPNKTLICSDLPDMGPDALPVLFQQYRGFVGVRMVPGKHLAFVDFENNDCATLAMERLQGFNLSKTHTLHLNYAK